MSLFSRAALVTAFFVFGISVVLAQSLSDIQNIKVDDLSDAQIQNLMNRAQAEGLSENDIYNVARSRSVPEAEIQKLRDRIAQLSAPEEEPQPVAEEPEPKPKEPAVRPEPRKAGGSYYYGYEFFENNSDLTFATDLYTPVPEEYILGPRDEVTINIFGSSEKLYKEVVSETGYLVIQNIGPVFVAGLTMRQAESRVKARLARLYRDLAGEDPTTFMNFSLSRIRNLKINIVGEVQRPGTYTVNALATVFNALYACGGPTKTGTLREIKVFRENKLIATVDYYEFLTGGVTRTNVTLQSGDLILVGANNGRVQISGQVRKPGYYEMKSDETFQKLLQYAGGFGDYAYSERIKVTRNTSREKVVSDLYKGQFEIFNVKAGDTYEVGRVLDRYKSRVTIKGAVYRPGSYAMEPDMTVMKLLQKADGLRRNAFIDRATLIRTLDDLTTETVNVNIALIQKGESPDIALQQEDVLTILSVNDLKDEQYVKISGEVNRGGVYPFSLGMTVQDLVFAAEGFSQPADPMKIEIARRAKNPSGQVTHEVIQLGVKDGVLGSAANLEEVALSSFDHVFVRRNPNFFTERTVEVSGEVLYPGKYALLSETERISDVLKRSGGLAPTAYVEGATILRKTEFFASHHEITSRKEDLEYLVNTLDTTYITEADEVRIAEIYDELNNRYLFPEEDDINLAANAKRERLLTIARQNPFLDGVNIKRVESMAIDLEKVFKNPGGPEDIVLEDDDIITVPKQRNTVRLRGRVLYPNTVRYEKSRSLRYYIGQAGGFGSRAKKNRTYVVYPNGEVAKTRNYLFVRSFPKAKPGSDVVVPTKPLKIPLKPGEIVGLTSGLATLGLIVTQIIQVNRN